MFDNDTLIVAYDEVRGESRGARKRSADYKAEGLGECINCTMCVQVCPTGIDIRDGLQYECIGCSACIDVCDDVMDKMGYEKGLIKYTTQNTVDGNPTKLLRPRIVIYALILVAFAAAFIYTLAVRVPLQLDVIRDRNTLFRETNEGLIENVYTLKLVNMDDYDHEFSLSAEGIEGMELKLEQQKIIVKGGQVLDLPVRLRADEADLKERSSKVFFNLIAVDNDKLDVTEEARFLGPRK
jgi:cytochrome c oxidase accessory protein FixG